MLITTAIAPGFTDKVQETIHAPDFLSQVHSERTTDSVVVCFISNGVTDYESQTAGCRLSYVWYLFGYATS